MKTIIINNNQSIKLSAIPVLNYPEFLEVNCAMVQQPQFHCVNYFGHEHGGNIKLYCCIADDSNGTVYISSCLVDTSIPLPSFTAHHLSFHVFERELAENFDLNYLDHPWLKPVRFPFNRVNKTSAISNYPFYSLDSEELHEVAVGPIHAGVIEPGHFRFICNGEQILHLEIQLGYQHRGIEQLFLEKRKLLQRTILAENIAGDTVAGHTTAFVQLWEALCKYQVNESTSFTRSLAQEMERIAVHTGDLSALCTDIAYQLGSSVFGRLRTPVINFLQSWCGNRLSKGLIRAGQNPYPMTKELANSLENMLEAYEPDFNEMCHVAFNTPTVLSRFEKTGVVSREQALAIGAVGMSARMTGLERDIRSSHPYGAYQSLDHIPITKHHGDVYSRVQVRKEEILQSIGYIRKMLERIPVESPAIVPLGSPGPDMFGISLVEGWRGEICHCAVTDHKGDILHYKVKDPSLHNWLALALSVRNNEISDFPVCNKSFNLSYCGHDL